MGPFVDFDPVKAAVGMFAMAALLLVGGIAAANFAAWIEQRREALLKRQSVWRQQQRWGRVDLLTSLELREEAFAELDGARLDLADEFLREDLHFLGGMAGVW